MGRIKRPIALLIGWTMVAATGLVMVGATSAGAVDPPPQAAIGSISPSVPEPDGVFVITASLTNQFGPAQPVSGSWTFSYDFDWGVAAAATPRVGADGTTCVPSGSRYDCTFTGTIPYEEYTADVELPFRVNPDLPPPTTDCLIRMGYPHCGNIHRFVNGVEQTGTGVASIIINARPVAFDDAFGIDPAIGNEFPLLVRANDRDREGHALSVDSITQMPRGIARIEGEDTIVYSPIDDLPVPDQIEYEVCDRPFRTCDTAVVTIFNGPDGPPNDDFANAEPIAGVGTWSGELAGATVEPDEPLHNSQDGLNLASIWYAWTPAVSGFHVINAYPPGLPAYGMSPAVYRVDPGSGGFHDLVAPPGPFFAGVTYYIAIEPGAVHPINLRNWTAGHVTLEISPFPTPHDNFAAAHDFDFALQPDGGSAGYQSPYNHSATAEAGEPAHGGSPASQSIWFAVSSRNRPGSFRFDYTAFDEVNRFANSEMRVAVYKQTGSGLAGLVPITPTNAAPLEWVTEPGARYYVAFDSGPPETWYIDLFVEFVPGAAPPPPTVHPGGGTVVEGNGGTRTMNVGVSLSAPSTQTVTVAWTTLQLSGPDFPDGTDYTPASGVVTFAPGETFKTVPIEVKGDLLDEIDEAVFLSWHSPTNAVVAGYGIGYGFIRDDDAPPRVVPGTASVTEGDVGTSVLDVPVSLSTASGKTVKVQWTTRPRSGQYFADEAVDYVPASGEVTFAPGETTKTVPIEVNGDLNVEPNELLVVSFRNPTNAVIGGFYGIGFGGIDNDD